MHITIMNTQLSYCADKRKTSELNLFPTRRLLSAITTIALLAFHAQVLYADSFLDSLKSIVVIKPGGQPQQTNTAQSNKQNSISQNPDHSPIQGASTSANFNLPNESNVYPDIIGIKLGISTPVDVKSILSKITPRLALNESVQVLMGRSVQGRALWKDFEIPNSKYIARIDAITQGNYINDQCKNYRDNCELIYVTFASPPNKAVALSINRLLSIVNNAPTIETVTQSLTEKYGEPGFQKVSGDRGSYHEMYWAWSAENHPIPLNSHHFCANPQTSIIKTSKETAQETAKAALKADCAAAMFVSLQTENGIVKSMRIQVANQFAIYTTQDKTSEYVNTFVKKQEEQERANAAKISSPQL